MTTTNILLKAECYNYYNSAGTNRCEFYKEKGDRSCEHIQHNGDLSVCGSYECIDATIAELNKETNGGKR